MSLISLTTDIHSLMSYVYSLMSFKGNLIYKVQINTFTIYLYLNEYQIVLLLVYNLKLNNVNYECKI